MKDLASVRFKDGDFKKSSMSHGGKKVCVLAAIKPEGVGVRDSKDQGKTTLRFTREEWAAFIAGVKKDEFNL